MFHSDFQLISCLLGVIKCDQSKTGAYIADLLLDCCNDWDIELDNVSCVVTDNGANIVNAVKLQFGEKRHLPCFAHTLNLIASKSVPLYNEAYGACLDPVIDSDDEDVDESDIKDAKHNSPEENMIIFIKKMKRIIKFFKKSETAMRELRKLQVIDGKKEGQCLMLILDVKTRWNSIMAMIERFLLIAGYVSRVLLIIPTSPPMSTSDELSVLKEVCKTLKPLEKVTTEMSAEKYVTCNKIIPLVRLLKISYGNMELESREAFSLKQRILHFISKYFKDIEKVRILATATLLDPRFKKIHFESALSASSAVFFVAEQIKDLANEATSISSDVEKNPARNESLDDLWSIHDSLVTEVNRAHVPDSAGGIPVELRQYLNTPLVPRTSDPMLICTSVFQRPQFPLNVYFRKLVKY
ncbi:uncharacterized protein LOC131689532 [Topomyia yanbarensis]|uniref:uncharacterized protein LOC131689532 n=1 Tax=Topomyia yanbarensis TaxID=2498891 RepID=UPI00273C302B|nr:uncharacterized protein LOC131689532 [Topomyia yanbarensis]